MRRNLPVLISVFAVFAAIFAAGGQTALYFDDRLAAQRHDYLMTKGAFQGAVRHGLRAIELGFDDDLAPRASSRFKTSTAAALSERGRFTEAADLLRAAIFDLSRARDATPEELAAISAAIGEAELRAGRVVAGAEIFHAFLELAGDTAAAHGHAIDPFADWRVRQLRDAGPLFAEHLSGADIRLDGMTNASDAHAEIAEKLAALGGFYAAEQENLYAAAALLSASHELFAQLNGADDPRTHDVVLMLARVYGELALYEQAEDIYLAVFHSQERRLGSNNPDLSLYLKLLAGVYQRQERMTEAEALFEHIRAIFRDAFGPQRYASNKTDDRRTAIDRPISAGFPFSGEYEPGDLVSAAEFDVPLAKAAHLDEMKVRLAADNDGDPRTASLPARLARLLRTCANESGEHLSLRSGYRSYETQAVLHERLRERGTVAMAGVSEHQAGLAVDINVDGRFMRASDKSFRCMEERAFQFGFILSFPAGNDYLGGAGPFEPWHWRYVGVETARLYREIGPINKPLEFLSELPCYQEMAAKGISPTMNGSDVCLAGRVSARQASVSTNAGDASD